jgi:hypothetical protein
LVRRLLNSNMCVLVEEELLPCTKQGRKLVGGLFGVPKSKDKQRLIFDRRPQNYCERQVKWSRLPYPAKLTRVVLSRSQVLRGSASDLSNYYYSIAHHASWIVRNAVGKRLSGNFVKEFGGCPTRGYFMCFRVLGMGDTNAVDFGQTIHENLLRQAGALVEKDTLRYGLPMPEGDLLQGVYIDDFLVLAKVARADVHTPGVDTARLHMAIAAYVAAGFEVADDKMYQHEVNFKAWGRRFWVGWAKSGHRSTHDDNSGGSHTL